MNRHRVVKSGISQWALLDDLITDFAPPVSREWQGGKDKMSSDSSIHYLINLERPCSVLRSDGRTRRRD